MKDFIKDWSDALLRASLIIIILFFCCFPARVDGNSMENTLSDGNIVFISRLASKLGMIENNDIVIASYYSPEKGYIKIIKRVVACEGQKVEIKNGSLFVDGEEISEPFALGKTCGDMSLTVPEGEYFVLGDNRENSLDSRTFGTIHKDLIVARALFKFFPLNKFEFY